MERCREIYDRIVQGGIDTINQFILDRESEELFLDFKRSSDNGKGNRLSTNDRNNLAKAISGFGNSEGGVIVWGIDCSTDFDGADVAKAKFPINNPKRFKSLLEGIVSGCTIPPHTRVEHHAIEEDSEKGYVISLIPKSNYAPHQMLPNKQYFIRAGSSFIPTPHDVLAGMFGRRPQAHVFHQFTTKIPELTHDTLNIEILFMVHNEGQGIAQDIFINCSIWELPGTNCEAKFDNPKSKDWTGFFEFGRIINLISPPNYRLPPGANAYPLELNLYLRPPFVKDLRIKGKVGAGNSRSYEFILENTSSKIKDYYITITNRIRSGSITDDEKHEFINKILSIDQQRE